MKQSLHTINTKKLIRALSLSTALLTLNAHAQFDKYKSNSNFNNSSSEAAQPEPADLNEDGSLDTSAGGPPTEMEEDDDDFSSANSARPMIDSKGQEDAFGRAANTSFGSTAATDKKYVNLNPETAFGPEVVTSFDFPDVSLIDLTKHMQKLVGINLILEKDLKGKVSIVAPTPITVGDAWKAYLTALNMNGYSLVKSGSFYKIVNSRDIRYTPTKIYTGTYTPDTENYVMRIIALKNVNSTEVTRSFRPFMTRYGRMIEIKQTNTIIVQDTGDNINRLVRLIKFIDVPGHDETLHIIPVKNTSAQEIAKILDQILRGQNSKFKNSGQPAGKTEQAISKIIAEPRTNSIITLANADGLRELQELIRKLDIKVTNQGSGQIHVYYLNHGDAESLSKTLSGLTQSSSKSKGNKFTKIPGTETEENLFNDEVKMTADKDNNALVVTASQTDWLTLKGVIEKLDIARDQVYVEGMIMETQVDNGRGFGITLIGAYGTGGAQKAGFVGGNGGQDLVNVLTNNITSLGGLFVGGGTGKTVNLGIGGQNVSVNTITGLVTAIANNSNTNVLATPQILVLDNTEASFEVGESVPVTESTISNNQTNISVRQQKAGLILKITPQINKITRFVKLKIDQKIEEFRTSANSTTAGGLATTSRATVTTVVVRDRDTIAMGGLMRDQKIDSESKVPLLGDIPILGWLFKNKQQSTSKVNMLFFLTPKIMDSYQKTVASTVKDLLGRRAGHLKEVIGEKDYFAPAVKGLFEKASKQEEGPLYDPAETTKYIKKNDNSSIDTNSEILENAPIEEIQVNEEIQEVYQPAMEAPDYAKIKQEISEKKAAQKK